MFVRPSFIFAQASFLNDPDDKESQQNNLPIEVSGDSMEYVMEGNKAIITGNARVTQGKTKLIADRIEFSKDASIAMAEGHVAMKSPRGLFSGDKLTYNFATQTGDFTNVKIMTIMEPSSMTSQKKIRIYAQGQKAAKLGENHIAMKNGYFTTCDLSDPHYRIKSKTIDIYPRDKLVARNISMKVGRATLVHFPRFTQALDGKPKVTFVPGFKKDWGMFLLTTYRAYLNDHVQATWHLDYREKRDVAGGVDLKYDTMKYGSGTVRTYYMNERPITSKRVWMPRPSPTPEHERFKVDWRHKWAIDEKTDAVLQYYKLSDSAFLKDYFRREYERDSSPQTFFLLTRNLSNGTVSFRTDARVNRFVGAVDRLPQIRYDISNQKIGSTRLYFKSANEYVNLAKKEPSPTEVRKETIRFDSTNEVSYPMKVGFIEMRPFVGGRQTYYSKTTDPSQYNILRGMFLTGADVNTKFYRVYDAKTNFMGLDINKLRHIITPSVSYNFNHAPTVRSSILDQYDSVDSLDQRHYIHLSLENKLQTKRSGISTDLLRFVADTDFNLKEDVGKGGFNHVKTRMNFMPINWLAINADTDYDTIDDRLVSANFDLHFKDPKKSRWTFDLEKRYSPDVDDQITTDWSYKINPKWKFRIYRRFDILHNSLKAQEYTITRDLHCWEMDINYNETRGSGSEIWIVFRLKAFPEMGLDFGTGFNKRKTGSQSSDN